MKNLEQKPIEDHEIDALVDGELPEASRHQLLLRLESHPEQWRRVALAFLEAHAFQTAWRSPVPPGYLHREISPARLERKRTSWQALLTLAATLLVAFFAGMLMNRDDMPRAAVTTKTSEPALAAAEQTAPLRLAFASQVPVEVKQKLLRIGYEVLEQPKLIHIQQGGRSIPVYVNDLKVRFVGRREVL